MCPIKTKKQFHCTSNLPLKLPVLLHPCRLDLELRVLYIRRVVCTWPSLGGRHRISFVTLWESAIIWEINSKRSILYTIHIYTLHWLIDDRLYSAILRSLEQIHCARIWFYMSDQLLIASFEYPPKWCTYSVDMARATWNCSCTSPPPPPPIPTLTPRMNVLPECFNCHGC